MTVHTIDNPSGTTTLEAIVNRAEAKAGDTLRLGPGVYECNDIAVRDVTIEGIGDASGIILRGALWIEGTVTIRNLTIQKSGALNGVSVVGGGSLDVESVLGVSSDDTPGSLVKAIGGQVTIRDSNLLTAATCREIEAGQKGMLRISNSQVGEVSLHGASAVVENSALSAVGAYNGASFEAQGFLLLAPSLGRLALCAKDGSSIHIEQLNNLTENATIKSVNSRIHIDSVMDPDGRAARMWGLVERSGIIYCSSPQFEFVEKDHRARPVEWLPGDAHNFNEVVLPRLRPGMTVQMGPGIYYLPSLALQRNLTLVGAGVDETLLVVEETLSVINGAQVALRNMSVRAAKSMCTAFVCQESNLYLTDVSMLMDETLEQISVIVEGVLLAARFSIDNAGTAADSCADVFNAELVSIAVRNEGYARFHKSDVGWLEVNHFGFVKLRDSLAYRLTASGGSRVEGSVVFRDNNYNKRCLIVDDLSSVTLNSATFEPGDHEGYVTGTATIGSTHIEEGGSFRIVATEGATVQVPPQVTVAPDDQTESQQPDPGAWVEPEVEPRPVDPMAELDKLIGLSKVKQQIRSFINQVRYNEARRRAGQETSHFSLHSMFLGNPGTGKTTVARLLGTALYQAGAIRNNTFVEVSREDLVADRLGGTAKKTKEILESALGGILFIDEAYTLYQESNNGFGQEAVDTILAFMENNRDDLMVIFAGYADRMQDLLSMNPGLASRISTRFDFEDYSVEEITTMGLKGLESSDYVVDEDKYRAAVSQKYLRSSGKSNGRWIRNFNEDLIRKQIDRLTMETAGNLSSLNAEQLKVIADDDVDALIGGDEEQKQRSIEEKLAELNAMAGLDNVKAWVNEMVSTARANKRLADVGIVVEQPSYHAIFTGNPGTGKTTVARIIAAIFHNLGILDTTTVKEVGRADLVGSVIGETEKKTSRVLDEAMGGVLFVDEAYTLAGQSDNDFGRIAIDTMLTRLEDDRDKFVAIFAGYTADMQRFLDTNEGLRSRIPRIIEFPDYTPEEIAGIVAAILAKTWQFNEPLVREVAALVYGRIPDNQRANARWARNFAKSIETRHMVWIGQNNPSQEEMLTIADVTVVDVAQSFLG